MQAFLSLKLSKSFLSMSLNRNYSPISSHFIFECIEILIISLTSQASKVSVFPQESIDIKSLRIYLSMFKIVVMSLAPLLVWIMSDLWASSSGTISSLLAFWSSYRNHVEILLKLDLM